MIRRFKKDPEYLFKYHLLSFIFLIVVNMSLLYLLQPTWQVCALFLPILLVLSSPQILVAVFGYALCLSASVYLGHADLALLAIPAALIITFPVSAFMHSTSHDSMRPKWLNRPVGELMGLFHLVGYPDWKILHVIHHAHADDPQWDPHPPGTLSYWNFAKGMRTAAAAAYVKYYFKHFSQSAESMQRLKRFSLMTKLDNFMRLTFWFLLLGPGLFSFFYATSLVAKMFHWAWFNWSTHRPTESGVDIQNHNHGLYKVVNFLAFGLYYHGNHHINPLLFDPRSMEKRSMEKSGQQQVA